VQYLDVFLGSKSSFKQLILINFIKNSFCLIFAFFHAFLKIFALFLQKNNNND